MDLKLLQRKGNGTISDYVYEVIRKNIISLNMVPGQQISEKEISEKLKVSRTPVREAFIKLAREGLLKVVPQIGTYISYIDLDLVEDIRFIRECLEKSVLKIATESFPEELIGVLKLNIESQKSLAKQKNFFDLLMMDEEFHKTIFMGCNKERTWSFIEQINSDYNRVRMLTFIADINWENVIYQHEQILDSIINKDTEKGQEVISNHIQKIIFEQMELKERYPQYFLD